MNAAIMWFVLSAFAEACIRLDISAEFWGVLHARNPLPAAERRPVPGAPDGAGIRGDAHGQLAVSQHAQTSAGADLPAELRRRSMESGFAG
jgi:hypothetical protein